MFHFKKWVIIGAALFVVTPAYAAEKVPYSALTRDYDACLATASSLQKWTSSYCLCISVELRNTLTFKEYLLLSSEVLGAIGDDGKVDRQKVLTMETVKKISSECQKEIASEM